MSKEQEIQEHLEKCRQRVFREGSTRLTQLPHGSRHIGLSGYSLKNAEPRLSHNDVTENIDFVPGKTTFIDLGERGFSLTGKTRITDRGKVYYFLRPTCPQEAVIVTSWSGSKFSAEVTTIPVELKDKLMFEEDAILAGKNRSEIVDTASGFRILLSKATHGVLALFR